MVAGDFCQLPPVGGKYVNVEPDLITTRVPTATTYGAPLPVTSYEASKRFGQFIFQSFTHSIERSSLKALLAAEKK